jgi:integrase/recombinase XerD
MPDPTISKQRPSVDANALSAHVGACLHELIDQGYAKLTVDRYRCGLGHFSHWLTRDKIAWIGQEEASVRRFLTTHLPSCDCSGRYPCDRRILSAALHQLLRSLRTRGHITAGNPGAGTIEEEVQRFDAYLEGICGLAAKTCRTRTDFVRRFLSARFARGLIDLADCSPQQIRQFVTGATQGWRQSSVAVLCGALRSYLRFRALRGECTDTLMAAVPRVAQWRAASLPTALSEAEIERFLSNFIRTTTEGRRNYAIALCLVGLGLRAGEVARLQLEDLNWREGTLQLKRTKGKRIDVLPLPVRTGQAIVQYLERRTARRPNRALFVRQRPPLDAPLTVEIVSAAMRQVYARAGIAKPWSGTHCLRHSLACRLVNAGIPLKEIADVLRHRSLNTTTIYAKVNVTQLASVALPWPGRVS